jgi:hypothetical protein
VQRADTSAVLHFAPPPCDDRSIAAGMLSRVAMNSCYGERFIAGAPTKAPIAAPRQA